MASMPFRILVSSQVRDAVRGQRAGSVGPLGYKAFLSQALGSGTGTICHLRWWRSRVCLTSLGNGGVSGMINVASDRCLAPRDSVLIRAASHDPWAHVGPREFEMHN